MTTIYLASGAQANVANALSEINEHATLSGSGLCRICQVEGPCARRITAEGICGPRIRDLTAKIEQLTARRADLTEMINSQPRSPSADAISQLRRTLAHVLQHGTPGQRKAIIETHIAEIKIQGALLIPIFLNPADDEGPAETSAGPRISHSIKVVGPGDSNPEPLDPTRRRKRTHDRRGGGRTRYSVECSVQLS
jgi:hypothetical protein